MAGSGCIEGLNSSFNSNRRLYFGEVGKVSLPNIVMVNSHIFFFFFFYFSLICKERIDPIYYNRR